MYNIAIIGAGQLGSRHLQGIKTADIRMSIFVVDNNVNALDEAKIRYEQVDNNPLINNISYLTSILDLPESIDLVIIATSSLPRAKIIRTLLKSKKVKNIVLEKFLFPKLSDYENVATLVTQHDVNVWVNCPRRMFPYYSEIKDIIKNADKIHFSIKGGDWGLGCNSIHFIDILSWLIGDTEYDVDLSSVDRQIITSKRSGYIEFTGTINGKFKSGSNFVITSVKDDTSPVLFTIYTNEFDVEINESQGVYFIKYKDSEKQQQESKIKILYQSQLSGILAKDILEYGNCMLTKYSESANLHTNLLSPLISLYNEITVQNSDICPIT